MTRCLPLLALLAAFATAGCSDDNDEIRAASDHVFRYDHWGHSGERGDDDASLTFTDMETGDEMKWKGGVRDALRHLERLNKGRCYVNPLSLDDADEVPCG